MNIGFQHLLTTIAIGFQLTHDGQSDVNSETHVVLVPDKGKY